MRTALQRLIIEQLSTPDAKYSVDTERGCVYSKVHGELRILKLLDGEQKNKSPRVRLYFNKQVFLLYIRHLVYLINYGEFHPLHDVVNKDKDPHNNKYWNLEAKLVKRQPWDPKKVHRNDLQVSMVRMHKDGMSITEIANRLLVNHQKVRRVIDGVEEGKLFRKFKRMPDRVYLESF